MAGMSAGVNPSQLPTQGTWGMNAGGQAQQFDSGTQFSTWDPATDAADTSPGGIGQYRAGGPNKIVWGGEVTEGSSGGNTSYNSQTGKQQYIVGYDNTGWNPGGKSPSLSGLQEAGGGGGAAGGGGTASFGGGGSGGDPGGSAAGGGASSGGKIAQPNISPSLEGLQSAGDSGGPGSQMLEGPSHFRQGIGARLMPNQDSSLAGLRKVY